MKALINRALYNVGIGIFFGAALAQADDKGRFLLCVGMIIGAYVYSEV